MHRSILAPMSRWLVACLSLVLLSGQTARVPAAPIEIPKVRGERLALSLFAAEPDIVTPIGLAIDARGRIFVLESHTHFPKADYPGPKYDRVKRFIDADRDGKPESITVFAEGLHHGMHLAFAPDGRLYATHRNGVVRLDDADDNGVCEAQVKILTMETRGDYPHNGIGAIAFSPDGWLYVGQGENLGEAYTLRGTDGRSHSGHGEGGNIFRCRPDGSQLEHVATGFWNPFGLVFFGGQYLMAVDNDPDSRPPNRLLDVVPGGDYGFKFRFGRTGLHPYQAWNGELPGTLPMVCGVGEGASAVLAGDRTALPGLHDGLLVSAGWDHRIEVAHPKSFGASLRSELAALVEGGENFRPIGLAAAPDGAVYFTDWVDVSYNVHGKGRIWRLQPKGAKFAPNSPLVLKPDVHRAHMKAVYDTTSPADLAKLKSALAGADDPFLRSAAITALARPALVDVSRGLLGSPSADMRLGGLLALRRANVADAPALLDKLLADPDPRVRLMALIWTGENAFVALTNRLSVALTAGAVTPALLRAHAATEQILSKATGGTKGGSPDGIEAFEFVDRPDEARAIEQLRAGAKVPLPVRVEAVRTLTPTTNALALARLRQLAARQNEPVGLRAEAVAALAGDPGSTEALLELLIDSAPQIQLEATRSLCAFVASPRVQAAFAARRKVLATRPADDPVREQLDFALELAGLGGSGDPPRPAPDEAWRKALEKPGDPASGRRVFFSPTAACGRCHRIEDQGGRLGPDLSTIARGADREKLMQSILHPSRDIAPQFVSHEVETKDGRAISGLLTAQGSDGTVTIVTAEGKALRIPGSQVVSHSLSKVSMMPEGLDRTMSVRDFRDLMAFLLSRR
jgi:putative membrane-bound dehydrogenase-like protein